MLIINVSIIASLLLVLVANAALMRAARRRVRESLPVVFPVHATVLAASTVIFIITTALAAAVANQNNDQAASALYAYPRWFMLMYVFLIGSAPPRISRHIVVASQAIIAALVVPITAVIAQSITTNQDIVADAVLIAKGILTIALYVLLYSRFSHVYVFGVLLTVVVICETVAVVSADGSMALYVWIAVPFVIVAGYLHETYSVRAQFAGYDSYIDFSVVCGLWRGNSPWGGGHSVGGRAVTLMEGHPSTILFEVKSLMESHYCNSRLVACYGFTVSLPAFCLVMERAVWTMAELRSMLASTTRASVVSLVWLADIVRAVSAIHTIDSTLSQHALHLTLDSFVVCKGGAKLRQARGKPETTHYVAPEMYARKVSDYQAVDMYALGVIFWELLHPRSTFSISWRHSNALPQIELDPLPDALVKILTDLLSRTPEQRMGANEVSLELDRMLYDGLGELVDELELEDQFSGRALVRILLANGVVINDIEGSRVGQYLLINMCIRPVRTRAEERDSLHADLDFEVHFEDSDLHFSLDQTYTLRAPSTMASPSLGWGDSVGDLGIPPPPRSPPRLPLHIPLHLPTRSQPSPSDRGSEAGPMTIEL